MSSGCVYSLEAHGRRARSPSSRASAPSPGWPRRGVPSRSTRTMPTDDALEDRAEAAERLELGGVAHHRGEHDREQLERVQILGRERVGRPREHVQEADGLTAVAQRHGDQRADPALVGEAGSRSPSCRRRSPSGCCGRRCRRRCRLEGDVLADEAAHEARRGAVHEIVAVEHQDRAAVGARQLLRPLADQVHDARADRDPRRPRRAASR